MNTQNLSFFVSSAACIGVMFGLWKRKGDDEYSTTTSPRSRFATRITPPEAMRPMPLLYKQLDPGTALILRVEAILTDISNAREGMQHMLQERLQEHSRMTNRYIFICGIVESAQNNWQDEIKEEVEEMISVLLGGSVMRHAVEWRGHLAELKEAMEQLSKELPPSSEVGEKTCNGEDAQGGDPMPGTTAA